MTDVEWRKGHVILDSPSNNNRLTDGIPYLEKARSIDPQHYINSFDLALAYLQAGKPEQSRELIGALLAKQDKAELHNLLGSVEAAEQHVEAAAKQFEIAARMDESEKNLLDLGSFLLSHNGFDQARIVFKYAVERYPKSAPLRVGLGIAHYSIREYDAAVERLCEAVDLDPQDTRALDFLGKMTEVSSKYAGEVKQRLARFVELYPQNASANYYYALSIRKRASSSGQPSGEAEQYLRKAIALKPDYAEAHYELGLLLDDSHQVDKAISEYETAVKLQPALARAHYRLAVLYRNKGREEQAQREFRKFAEMKQAEK
jgi:tetratricopeptide (TPR) repeat protein